MSKVNRNALQRRDEDLGKEFEVEHNITNNVLKELQSAFVTLVEAEETGNCEEPLTFINLYYWLC